MSDESASKNKLRVVDLCAGLGGFHQGIHEFFADKDLKETKFGTEWDDYECVLASELNEELRENYVKNHRTSLNYEYYSKHFPEDGEPEDIDKSIKGLFSDGFVKIHDDMSLLVDEEADNDSKDVVTARLNEIEEQLNLKEHKQAYLERFQKGTVRKWLDKESEDYVIPEFDMLCAGFPCQPFSQSGKQQGFNDERGNVWNMIRIILQSRQPRYVFLENVPNFKSHDKGNTWKRVHDELLILGYKVHARVLSPQDVGELQTRKRFFIVGQRVNDKFSPFDRTLPPINREDSALDIIKENPEKAGQSSSKIPKQAVKAIEHWQILLNMVHAYNQWCSGSDSLDKIIPPGFPIWGYELDPVHFYPPSDLVSTVLSNQHRTPKELQVYVDKLNEGRRDQLTKYLRPMDGELIQQLTKPNRPSEPEWDFSDDDIYLQQIDNYLETLQKYRSFYDAYAESYKEQSRDLETFYGRPVGSKRSIDQWKDWLEDKGNKRPTYTKNDKGWNPQSKSQYDKKQFIERVRKWAVQDLFGKIATKAFDDFIRNCKDKNYDFLFRSDKHSPLFRFSFVDIDAYCQENYPQLEQHHRWLRWWLDKLKEFPHSYQKLELTIGDTQRERHVCLHGEYLLQTRPSGIRVKDPSAIPTLVAQGDSQVPIYSEYNSENPNQELSDVFKKISINAQLAFQGFPKRDKFVISSSPSAASKALGNAVNVKLITAILKLWLLPQTSSNHVDSGEQP